MQSLYHSDAQGALTQYDFNSNYAKCSSVPLIQDRTNCSTGHPIIGFNLKGEPICSANHVSVVAGGCAGQGQVIQRIFSNGTVQCNQTTGPRSSRRIPIIEDPVDLRPVNRRNPRGCHILPFADLETYLYDNDWMRSPPGRRTYPRKKVEWRRLPPYYYWQRYPYWRTNSNPNYEAGGFIGLLDSGRLMTCLKTSTQKRQTRSRRW